MAGKSSQQKISDHALKYAWQTLVRYDSVAQGLKRSHIRLRVFVLILSFFSSLLAVFVGFLAVDRQPTFYNVYPLVWLVIPIMLFFAVWLERRRRDDYPEDNAIQPIVELEGLDAESDTDTGARDNEAITARGKRLIWYRRGVILLFFVLLIIQMLVLFQMSNLTIENISQVVAEITQGTFDFMSESFVIAFRILPAVLIVVCFVVYLRLSYHIRKESNQKNQWISDATLTFFYWFLLGVIILMIPFVIAEIIRLQPDSIIEGLRLILFALPLISTGILAYATKFIPSQRWVQFRYATEGVRREIYLYRFGAEHYKDKNKTERSEEMFKRINQITLGKIGDTKNQTIQEDHLASVEVLDPDHSLDIDDDKIRQQVRDTKFDPDSKKDDGFMPLNLEQYIQYRVVPMYR